VGIVILEIVVAEGVVVVVAGYGCDRAALGLHSPPERLLQKKEKEGTKKEEEERWQQQQ
jgi:hypothetical protein